ncbi:hypothetical protein MNV49_001146 [Pseudohyphozyma bogoriensis]|nr:hypothetical protein MNV49_001146 [Pseudohyphozyma bogoriensis]
MMEDKLWDVDCILDESATSYLLKWSDIDPATGEIYEPTWEPKGNAEVTLIREWRRKQLRQWQEEWARELGHVQHVMSRKAKRRLVDNNKRYRKLEKKIQRDREGWSAQGRRTAREMEPDEQEQERSVDEREEMEVDDDMVRLEENTTSSHLRRPPAPHNRAPPHQPVASTSKHRLDSPPPAAPESSSSEDDHEAVRILGRRGRKIKGAKRPKVTIPSSSDSSSDVDQSNGSPPPAARGLSSPDDDDEAVRHPSRRSRNGKGAKRRRIAPSSEDENDTGVESSEDDEEAVRIPHRRVGKGKAVQRRMIISTSDEDEGVSSSDEHENVNTAALHHPSSPPFISPPPRNALLYRRPPPLPSHLPSYHSRGPTPAKSLSTASPPPLSPLIDAAAAPDDESEFELSGEGSDGEAVTRGGTAGIERRLRNRVVSKGNGRAFVESEDGDDEEVDELDETEQEVETMVEDAPVVEVRQDEMETIVIDSSDEEVKEEEADDDDALFHVNPPLRPLASVSPFHSPRQPQLPLLPKSQSPELGIHKSTPSPPSLAQLNPALPVDLSSKAAPIVEFEDEAGDENLIVEEQGRVVESDVFVREQGGAVVVGARTSEEVDVAHTEVENGGGGNVDFSDDVDLDLLWGAEGSWEGREGTTGAVAETRSFASPVHFQKWPSALFDPVDPTQPGSHYYEGPRPPSASTVAPRPPAASTSSYPTFTPYFAIFPLSQSALVPPPAPPVPAGRLAAAQPPPTLNLSGSRRIVPLGTLSTHVSLPKGVLSHHLLVTDDAPDKKLNVVLERLEEMVEASLSAAPPTKWRTGWGLFGARAETRVGDDGTERRQVRVLTSSGEVLGMLGQKYGEKLWELLPTSAFADDGRILTDAVVNRSRSINIRQLNVLVKVSTEERFEEEVRRALDGVTWEKGVMA